MRHVFSTEQWLPYPPELVFSFFANPANLPPLMPGWQKARINAIMLVPPPLRPAGSAAYQSPAAGSGTRLTITARPFPLSPLRGAWDALMEDFRWNESFCDVQLRGPFHYWRHCHSVRAATQGERIGTVVRDEVHYELPGGPLGNLANRLGARAAMGVLFRFRQARAIELLAAAPPQLL